MKKIMIAMLGLSLFVGAVSTFAADDKDTTKTTKAKKMKKAKKTDTTSTK